MYVVILVTTKNVQEGKKIVKKLLEKKLIACGNIIKAVESLFWWQGKIDKANESLLILKAKRTHFKKIVNQIKEIHSYSVPEIIALPIVDGNSDYLDWIKESVK